MNKTTSILARIRGYADQDKIKPYLFKSFEALNLTT